MKKSVLIARIVLGLIYFVFGLNGFFQFLPMPEMPPEAGAFLGGLAGSGYFFPFLKATEVLCGAALLSGMFTHLALVVLAPITLNIFLFHAMLAPEGIAMAALMLLVHLYLGYSNMSVYRPILRK